MRGITKKQKEAIFERAGGCCEYCLSLASFSSQPFSIEHIHPQHLGGGSDLDNLALSCQGCNGHKGKRTERRDPATTKILPLYNTRQHRGADNISWEDDLKIVIGITPTGRATIEVLHLNREGVVNLRRALRQIGVHPPALTER